MVIAPSATIPTPSTMTPLRLANSLETGSSSITPRFRPAQKWNVMEKGAGLGIAGDDAALFRPCAPHQKIGKGKSRSGRHNSQAVAAGDDFTRQLRKYRVAGSQKRVVPNGKADLHRG